MNSFRNKIYFNFLFFYHPQDIAASRSDNLFISSLTNIYNPDSILSGFEFQEDPTTTMAKPEPKQESKSKSFLQEDIDTSKLKVITVKFENKSSSKLLFYMCQKSHGIEMVFSVQLMVFCNWLWITILKFMLPKRLIIFCRFTLQSVFLTNNW